MDNKFTMGEKLYMDNKLSMGEKLCNLRRERNISQEEFGSVFNVTRQTVGRWESNSNLPDMDKIIEIAKYFDVPTSYLLNVDDETFERGSVNEDVKKIVNGYVNEVNDEVGKFKKNFKQAFIIAIGIFFVIFVTLTSMIVSYNNKYDRLDYNYRYLLSVVNNLKSQISSLNIPNYPSNTSELFSVAKIYLGDFDFAQDTVELNCNISLKEFKSDTKLKLVFSFDGKSETFDIPLVDGIARDTVTLPISDEYKITATVINDDGNKNEELNVVFGLRSASQVGLIPREWDFIYMGKISDYKESGLFPIRTKGIAFELLNQNLKQITLEPTEIKVSMYINDKFICYGKVWEYENYDFGDMPNIPEYHEEEGSKFMIADFEETKMKWEDVVSFHVEITDNTGRKYEKKIAAYKLVENFSNKEKYSMKQVETK